MGTWAFFTSLFWRHRCTRSDSRCSISHETTKTRKGILGLDFVLSWLCENSMRAVAPDISKSPSRIASMFDAIADRYDLLNHLLSAGIDRRWRRHAIRSLALTGRERVLDLCTGTADLAIAALTARPSAARVMGVDFAPAMLRVGSE